VVLAGFGVEAAANLPEGGLTLSHVVELVLIVAVTTNFLQYTYFKCSVLPRSKGSHMFRFAAFYLAALATPFLCFPKADVVVGDLMPSTQSFAYLPGPKQHSAILGTALLLASAVVLVSGGRGATKGAPLLAPPDMPLLAGG